MADVPGKPIANWLRRARQSQRMPNGRSWTYNHLFEQMRERIGWAPAHPNYSKYENGKATPQPETLEKFTEFWATVPGAPGLDLTPEPEPVDPQIALASAIQELAAELRLLRESQAQSGAATADLVALAIRETLRGAGLVVEPQPS